MVLGYQHKEPQSWRLKKWKGDVLMVLGTGSPNAGAGAVGSLLGLRRYLLPMSSQLRPSAPRTLLSPLPVRTPVLLWSAGHHYISSP